MSKAWITKNAVTGIPKLANKAQLAMGCINHTCRNTTKDGYGVVCYDGKEEGHQTSHKLAYTQSIGIEYDALPRGKIKHTCKNKRCINPDHLVFVEFKECKDGIRLQAYNARIERLILTVPDQLKKNLHNPEESV